MQIGTLKSKTQLKETTKGAVDFQAAVPKYTTIDSVTESKRFGSTDQQLAKQLV